MASHAVAGNGLVESLVVETSAVILQFSVLIVNHKENLVLTSNRHLPAFDHCYRSKGVSRSHCFERYVEVVKKRGSVRIAVIFDETGRFQGNDILFTGHLSTNAEI